MPFVTPGAIQTAEGVQYREVTFIGTEALISGEIVLSHKDGAVYTLPFGEVHVQTHDIAGRQVTDMGAARRKLHEQRGASMLMALLLLLVALTVSAVVIAAASSAAATLRSDKARSSRRWRCRRRRSTCGTHFSMVRWTAR